MLKERGRHLQVISKLCQLSFPRIPLRCAAVVRRILLKLLNAALQLDTLEEANLKRTTIVGL